MNTKRRLSNTRKATGFYFRHPLRFLADIWFLLAAVLLVGLLIGGVIWYLHDAAPLVYFPTDRAGFWFGLLHGFFLGLDFIVSWFNPDITLYQAGASSFWYNLGFLMGVGAFTTPIVKLSLIIRRH
ncbi:MAG TPA: hypothetical protein VLI05_00025 [Candidatus Saccharimonadia bacterium]|nr:hypothetical protein [Candidatus Saccharimonadia bacterium]